MTESDDWFINQAKLQADRARMFQQQADAAGWGKPPTPFADRVTALLAFVQKEGGQLVITADPPDPETHPDSWQCSVGLTFGQEEPGSDMAAGAVYAIEDTVLEALDKVMTEVRI